MRDLRQSPGWAYYLSNIGWTVKKLGNSQLFSKKIPLINRPFVKFQRPDNPLNFKNLDKLAKQNKWLFVIIEPTADKFNEDRFKQAGFKKAPKMSLTHTSSIHINLTKPLDKILMTFSENARRNIRKAEKNNLEVIIVDLKKEESDEQFKIFYRLFANLTKIKKFWAPGYNEYHKKMIGFKDSSVILFAYHKKQPVAAVWLGIFDNSSWYMNTGIALKGYELLANYLLVWEAIKYSKKRRLKIFDFEGIYDPRFPSERSTWKKFTEFKKRFHGDIIEYPPPYIKIYSLGFKIFYLCTQKFYR